MSPSQDMARALFHVAKRAWYADQQRRWPRPEPPAAPVPGEAWFSDPRTLPIQIKGVSPPHDAGTSVKIDPGETDLAKAFRPRPFLVVSNEDVLDQGFAWVCPLSSLTEMKPSRSLPEWVVPIPELNSYCLAAKLHTVETEFFLDVADRELLRFLGEISPASARKVRAAILRHLEGAFAPSRDPLPPGTILRHKDGTERLIVANCALGSFYRGAGTLTTTCLVERAEYVCTEDHHRPVPDLVPFPVPATDAGVTAVPTGYVDLVDLRSENQARLVKKRVRHEPTVVPSIRAAFRTLLLGEDEEAAR